MRLAERVGGGEVGAHGIDLGAVFQDLVVQVGAAGDASGADISDNLPLLDLLPHAQALGIAVQVGIGGAKGAVVLDLHVVAVAAACFHHSNHAVSAGFDRCAGGGGEVCPPVCTGVAQHWVFAVEVEVAGNAREL